MANGSRLDRGNKSVIQATAFAPNANTRGNIDWDTLNNRLYCKKNSTWISCGPHGLQETYDLSVSANASPTVNLDGDAYTIDIALGSNSASEFWQFRSKTKPDAGGSYFKFAPGDATSKLNISANITDFDLYTSLKFDVDCAGAYSILMGDGLIGDGFDGIGIVASKDLSTDTLLMVLAVENTSEDAFSYSTLELNANAFGSCFAGINATSANQIVLKYNTNDDVVTGNSNLLIKKNGTTIASFGDAGGISFTPIANMGFSLVSSGATGWIRFNSIYIDEDSNFTIGSTDSETDATKVLTINNGTAPDNHIDNHIQIFSTDSSDTTATLGLFLEQAIEAGAPTASHKLKIKVNGTEYWIGLDAV